MSEKPLATPRGSRTDNETKDLECQTGTTAHTEPKGRFGEVSNHLVGPFAGIAGVWALIGAVHLVRWALLHGHGTALGVVVITAFAAFIGWVAAL